jgi:hypothetical protein
VIALVLGVCALAIPASASAVPLNASAASQVPHGADYSSVSPTSEHKSASAASQVPHGAAYSSVGAIPAPTSESTVVALRRDGSQAEPTVVSASPSDSGDGFDWGDAAVGAGAAMTLVALGGAALFTVRRRPGGLPSASTG